jgi:hypothetical protein
MSDIILIEIYVSWLLGYVVILHCHHCYLTSKGKKKKNAFMKTVVRTLGHRSGECEVYSLLGWDAVRNGE